MVEEMEVEVRLARRYELAPLVDLWRRCLEDQLQYEDKLPPVEANLVYYEAGLRKRIAAGEVIVGVMGPQIVGQAILSEEILPMVVNLRTGILSDMWVEEEWRRKGLASRLVRFAQEQARDRKFDKVRLQVYEGNEGARALYEKFGFQTTLEIMDWTPGDSS